MNKQIGLLSFLLLFTACAGNQDGITPEHRDITESVYASVEIQPDSLYQAYAVVSGIIEEVMVSEGDNVRAGDPLLRIRNEAPELNRAKARLALKQAEADVSGNNSALTDLESQIRTAELQLRDDSINYNRQKRLWEQNIGSRLDFERKELALDLSANQLANLKSAYRKLKNDLEIRYEQAQINLKVAEVNTGDYTVKSRINGMVYAVQKQVGEKVSQQESVAILGSSDTFVIELLIDERDIARIKSGQQILMSLEAYENTVFTASVTKIYPQKNDRNQTFLVEGIFNDDAPEALYAGLSGEANSML